MFNIVHWDWTILRAVNPRYWIMFLVNEGTHGWHLLGSIVLCITGSPHKAACVSPGLGSLAICSLGQRSL